MTNEETIQRLKELASAEGADGVVEQGMYSYVVEMTVAELISYWNDMMRSGGNLHKMIRDDIDGVITGLQAVRDAILS